MAPTYRIAAESDAELLLRMMREYYTFDGHPFDESRSRTALITLLRDPSFGRAWLVCDNSEPVGYLVLILGYSLEYLGRDAFIDELYLRESHRGRGWGRLTPQFVEEEAPALRPMTCLAVSSAFAILTFAAPEVSSFPF